jgi:hypothetical protein
VCSVLALLAKKTNIDPATLEVSTARLDLGLRASGTCEMHSDFHSSKSYVFTAIVYLSNWGDSFTGGETVFAHEIGGGETAMASAVRADIDDSQATAAIPMTGGYIVQPKIGRVVVFTGGTENLHCKMPSTTVKRQATSQGNHSSPRTVVQLWIRCSTDKNTRPDMYRMTAAQLASDSDIVARARSWLRENDSLEAARLAERLNTDRALP